ncbi:hypothetical protein BDV06DRAFT_232872 [Aspergillus oleicola]
MAKAMLLLHFPGPRATLLVLTRSIKSLFSKRCYSHQHLDPPLNNVVGNPTDFFRHTSGRWLWNEEEQLRARYREFDIAELQRVAVDASSAGPCVRMKKLGEGTYNKAFKLTMANNKTVVARIPNPNAGPAFLTTASEVATMDFLRNVLHIPVPKHAPGTQLAFVWPDMNVRRNMQTIKDIVEIQHKLLLMRFSSYGCLYFSEDAPPGSHPAILNGDDLSHEFKKSIADKFSPLQRASALGYIQAPALREISWLENFADPNPSEELVMPYRNVYPPAEHISVIQRYLPLTPHLLPSEEDIAGAFLCHADLTSPNIFVDGDGRITSIIDWQSSAACPLFVEGRPPRFLDYKGEQIFKLPEDFDTLDEEKQKSIKNQRDQSMMLYIYNDHAERRNPLLHKVFNYLGGQVLWDPINMAGGTWDGDVLTLRETLIRVHKHWDLFDCQGKCPLNFSPEEISKHNEDGEYWNEVQDLWDSIRGVLDRDGWTSNETYEAAKSIYAYFQNLPGPESNKPG